MSDDLALTRLPQILRDFRRDNPLVDLDLTVDQSGIAAPPARERPARPLPRQATGRGGGRPAGAARTAGLGRQRRHQGWPLDRPVPLVVYPAPSISRTLMQTALEIAGHQHRPVCICRGVNGLIAAVSAGIGISAMARSLVPADLTVLGAAAPAARARPDRPGAADQPQDGGAGVGPGSQRDHPRERRPDALPLTPADYRAAVTAASMTWTASASDSRPRGTGTPRSGCPGRG